MVIKTTTSRFAGGIHRASFTDGGAADKIGPWTEGTGLKGFVGYGYLYSSNKESKIRFKFDAPATGKHEIRLGYLYHENRASNAQVRITVAGKSVEKEVNMKEAAPLENNFISLGVFSMVKGEPCVVELAAAGANGNIHADAVQVVRVP